MRYAHDADSHVPAPAAGAPPMNWQSRLALDRDAPAGLARQLASRLQELIVHGELAAGDRLPPSRTLADWLGIGRITVTTAYAQLAADGFVTARPGAGTFVAAVPPGAPTAPPPSLSAWGRQALAAGRAERAAAEPRGDFDFGFGRVFPHSFPYDVWRRLLARYLSTDDTMLARYGSPAGFEPLRRALADYVATARNIHCRPEQIIIVNGTQQAIDLLARLLLNPGDRVAVESPGYVDAYELLRVYQAQLLPVAVDGDGLQVAHLPADGRVALVYVTPANQFPLGGTLALPRRLALLDWAAQHGAFILEDDYDSELRYDGRLVTALQAVDTGGRVIYLGTFSKVLFPALRLAYVILPDALVTPFYAAKRLVDRGSPTLTQAAVADFLAEGHFARHMRRLRQTYGARRDVLVAALARHLGDVVSFVDAPAGLHVTVQLPDRVDEARLVRDAAEAGLILHPGAGYHVTPGPPSLLLGFSGIAADRIDDGIRRLAGVIRSHGGRAF